MFSWCVIRDAILFFFRFTHSSRFFFQSTMNRRKIISIGKTTTGNSTRTPKSRGCSLRKRSAAMPTGRSSGKSASPLGNSGPSKPRKGKRRKTKKTESKKAVIIITKNPGGITIIPKPPGKRLRTRIAARGISRRIHPRIP